LQNILAISKSASISIFKYTKQRFNRKLLNFDSICEKDFFLYDYFIIRQELVICTTSYENHTFFHEFAV
jgi:hypothetical protein